MTPVQLALALAVAQVAVNEAGFDSDPDVALVWQAVEAHGSTPGRQLDWLRRHSWTVFEGHHRGNARWSGHLRWDDEEPEGWPQSGPAWSVYRARWHELRKLAAALVMGWLVRIPCNGPVTTWGSDEDHTQAVRRGLRPVECKGTRNTGFAPRRAGS